MRWVHRAAAVLSIVVFLPLHLLGYLIAYSKHLVSLKTAVKHYILSELLGIALGPQNTHKVGDIVFMVSQTSGVLREPDIFKNVVHIHSVSRTINYTLMLSN